MLRPISLLSVLVIACVASAAMRAQENSPSAPASANAAIPDRWPKSAQLDGATYTVYQPQLDFWDYYTLAAHAAVSVLPPGQQNPVYGFIQISAKTRVDRVARTVYFTDTTVHDAKFPTAPNWATSYQQAIQALFVKGPFTISLDRMEAALAVAGADKNAQSVPVRNPVPAFVFSKTPAVLASIDGEPVWRAVTGTPYERVLNTRPLLLRDASGTIYFHLFDGFLQAPGLAGPWTLSANAPAGVASAAANLGQTGAVDLMEGPADDKTGKKPSLQDGAPTVIVVTRPTELIVTDGESDLIDAGGGHLLYVENTDANVFLDVDDQQVYVLVSGRWFKAPDYGGPWQYVAANDLPPAFAQLPDDSPKENVKASIPGTAQANEAIIASQIPQTAQVDRTKATFTPQIAGAPELEPIEGTQLSYVANTPVPLIQLPTGQWYALESAVWFQAPTLQGPWSVAAVVPAEIYSIPPSSPLYYATYVQVYDSTPTTVTVGYLPGYMGAYVAADGTVVYGTGYAYTPYIGTTVWYGFPVTYGYAAGLVWTPWTGWGIGFGLGWAYGAAWGIGAWGWGCAPYWGAYYRGAWGARGAYGAWGPHGWAANSGNVYHQWGNTGAVTRSSAGYNAWTGRAWSGQVGHSYNSQTGRISAGQRGTVGNVYSGNYASDTRGATYNPSTGVSASGARGTLGNAYTGQSTNVGHANISGPGGNEARTATVGNNHYADVNGNVYRNTGSGWEQHSSSGWSSASQEGARSMQSEQQARSMGEQRASASSFGGGNRSFGGGFRGSGGGFSGGGGFRGGGGGGSRGGGGRR